MYTFRSTHTVPAPRAEVWSVWSDLAAYPEWDPRELELRLHGPLAPGTAGWSKQRGNPGGPFRVDSVDEGHGWVNISELPGGELRISHRLREVDGGTTVEKRYDVIGPMGLAFRVWWGPATLRALRTSWAALDARVEAVRAG